VVRLADGSSDGEWAQRAPRVDPLELARLARNASKPSAEEGRKRFAARELQMWWTPDNGMLNVRGQLPDVMGARFEQTITKLTEQMKPVRGQPWAPFDQRAADALVASCDVSDAEDEHAPSLGQMPVLQWQVPLLRRAVLLRDGCCRVPGCGRRRGLQVHHLVPRSRGGTDDIANLAAVCPAHHRLLIPHGLLALVGNPNLPDGLELVTAGRAPPSVVRA
jgi:hypothetical protein